MEVPQEKMEEYVKLLSDWFDEAANMEKSIHSMFASTSEGFLKYLFTLHVMMKHFTETYEVPDALFVPTVEKMVAVWFAYGKPENMQFRAGILKVERSDDEHQRDTDG